MVVCTLAVGHYYYAYLKIRKLRSKVTSLEGCEAKIDTRQSDTGAQIFNISLCCLYMRIIPI
jgi:hypothetical protein